MEYYYDKNGELIRGGYRLYNPANDPVIVDILELDGELYLGDFETPLSSKYGFEKFWEIRKRTLPV